MTQRKSWSFKAVDSGEAADDAPFGWVEGIANAAIVDRYDEMVLPAALAAAVPGFLQNPVLSFGHGIEGNPVNGTLPAGSVLKLWQDAQGNTCFRARWANTPDAQLVRGMYQAGDMRGFSVQFIPLETRTATPEELTKWPTLRRVITKLDLIEIACAVVPVNAGSLATAAKSLAAPRRLAVPDGGKPMDARAMSAEEVAMVAEQVKAYNATAESMAACATALEELQAKAGEADDHAPRLTALMGCQKSLGETVGKMAEACKPLATSLGVSVEVEVDGDEEPTTEEPEVEGDEEPTMDEEQAKALTDQISKALRGAK